MTEKEEVKGFKSRKRAEGTVFVSVSAFPDSQWAEWNKDCKERYGDCRWFKMWNDHMNAKEGVMYNLLIKKITELELEIASLKGDKPDESGVKTMKGTIKSGESD